MSLATSQTHECSSSADKPRKHVAAVEAATEHANGTHTGVTTTGVCEVLRVADKWADYLISAVRYNAAGTHIDQVMVRPDNGNTVGAGAPAPRIRVVNLILAGTTFATRSQRSCKTRPRNSGTGALTSRSCISTASRTSRPGLTGSRPTSSAPCRTSDRELKH